METLGKCVQTVPVRQMSAQYLGEYFVFFIPDNFRLFLHAASGQGLMLKNNDVNSYVPEFFIICRVCLGPLIYDTRDLVTVRRMDVDGNEIAVRPGYCPGKCTERITILLTTSVSSFRTLNYRFQLRIFPINFIQPTLNSQPLKCRSGRKMDIAFL